MMPTRRWASLLLFLAGCSNRPIVDTLDFFKPGRLYPDRVTPYGGVCIPQGAAIVGGTTPSIGSGPPVIPPATPLPPSGGITIPNLPAPPGSVVPVPNAPPPNFPVAP